MDIQLPVMDGYEVARRIKADPALWHIPIIAVTSYALSGDEAKTREAGCDGYVAKPFSPRQLLAKINQFVPYYDGFPNRRILLQPEGLRSQTAVALGVAYFENGIEQREPAS
jgi:DNA-binding response OmpR family regulator